MLGSLVVLRCFEVPLLRRRIFHEVHVLLGVVKVRNDSANISESTLRPVCVTHGNAAHAVDHVVVELRLHFPLQPGLPLRKRRDGQARIQVSPNPQHETPHSHELPVLREPMVEMFQQNLVIRLLLHLRVDFPSLLGVGHKFAVFCLNGLELFQLIRLQFNHVLDFRRSSQCPSFSTRAASSISRAPLGGPLSAARP